jgi:hypothetical protein
LFREVFHSQNYNEKFKVAFTRDSGEREIEEGRERKISAFATTTKVAPSFS